jgi:hypothetical protein
MGLPKMVPAALRTVARVALERADRSWRIPTKISKRKEMKNTWA